MKAAVFYGNRTIRIEDIPLPGQKDDEVLIKVKYTGICGSDGRAYSKRVKANIKRIMGHESSGVVQKIGDRVENFKPGDRVVVDPNITCGKCYFCRMDERNYYCLNKKVLGGEGWLNGGLSEYIIVPEKVVYRVSGISLEKATFTEPIACCIRAADRLNIKSGDVVVILGSGVIGLLALQLVKLSGASRIIVTDISDFRLEKAKLLGADITVNDQKTDIYDVIMSVTDGIGVDRVIEAAGKVNTIYKGLDILRRGGHMCILGVASPDEVFQVSPYLLYEKEITITSSYCNPFTFGRSLKLLESGKINTEGMVTHRFKLKEIKKAFDTMINDDTRIKIIITQDQS